MKGKTTILMALAVALCLSLIVSGCGGSDESESSVPSQQAKVEEKFGEGVSYAGVDISGLTMDEALKLCANVVGDEMKKLKITVKEDEHTAVFDSTNIKYTDKTAETLKKAMKNKSKGKIKAAFTVDEAAVKDVLTESLGQYDTEPKNATVTGLADDGFTFSESVDGKKIDVDITSRYVVSNITSLKSGPVTAKINTTPAKIKLDALKNNFTQIASYQTYSQNTENGNHNMALALSRVNGTIIEPGGSFSYNDTVGDSTNASTGFLPAGGLSAGVLVDMYGGGICQASSTIYCAVLKAGMEITNRECHSSPSTYVPIGLDATVSYDDLDFEFSNPLEYPVYIEAWMDGVELNVNVYGVLPEEWDAIELSSWETGTEDIPDGINFVVDYDLAEGEFELKTEGKIGHYAEAVRTYYKDGNEVRSESLSSSYYEPTMKTYMVGPGTDTENFDPDKKK